MSSFCSDYLVELVFMAIICVEVSLDCIKGLHVTVSNHRMCNLVIKYLKLTFQQKRTNKHIMKDIGTTFSLSVYP